MSAKVTIEKTYTKCEYVCVQTYYTGRLVENSTGRRFFDMCSEHDIGKLGIFPMFVKDDGLELISGIVLFQVHQNDDIFKKFGQEKLDAWNTARDRDFPILSRAFNELFIDGYIVFHTPEGSEGKIPYIVDLLKETKYCELYGQPLQQHYTLTCEDRTIQVIAVEIGGESG